MLDGVEKILQEVKYVPELKRNLIFFGKLDMHGYYFKSEKETTKISRGSLVFIKGVRKNGLYILIGATVLGKSSNTKK